MTLTSVRIIITGASTCMRRNDDAVPHVLSRINIHIYIHAYLHGSSIASWRAESDESSIAEAIHIAWSCIIPVTACVKSFPCVVFCNVLCFQLRLQSRIIQSGHLRLACKHVGRTWTQACSGTWLTNAIDISWEAKNTRGKFATLKTQSWYFPQPPKTC